MIYLWLLQGKINTENLSRLELKAHCIFHTISAGRFLLKDQARVEGFCEKFNVSRDLRSRLENKVEAAASTCIEPCGLAYVLTDLRLRNERVFSVA